MPVSKSEQKYKGMSDIERFAAKYCKHTKGGYAGQPFLLLPWEKEVLDALFCTLNPDGTRRYRTAYIEVPKKNGKTQLCALIGLYMLMVDPEPEAEVYSCAVDRKQAALCFEAAKSMVLADPTLSKKVKVLKWSMEYTGKRGGPSRFSPRSRESKTAHGINPSCLILDELHIWPSGLGRDYYDALTAGDINRRQPLTIMITTAGDDQTSVCWEQHEYARQVKEGILDDPTFYTYIVGCDKDADWTDPKVWEKANPSYGVTVSPEAMERKCREAQNNPAKQNSFRRLHLNQWVQQENRWLDLQFWDKCGATLPDLAGRKCYGGLDLAATIDLCAYVLLFPPEEDGEPWWVLPKFWLPEDDILDRGRRDQVPYADWARDGYLDLTRGNVTDYEFIQKHIKEDADKYRIQEIGFDRKFAHQLVTNLGEDGIEMVQMAQGAMTLDSPMRALEAMLLSGSLAHGGHPVLRWNADNMVVRLDANANMAPDKKKARQKIDGVVSLIMAIGRATAGNEMEEEITDASQAIYFG